MILKLSLYLLILILKIIGLIIIFVKLSYISPTMQHQYQNQFPLVSSESYNQAQDQENINWSNKKKISTPALLFCKSGQKDQTLKDSSFKVK